jgi:hypothetical protein
MGELNMRKLLIAASLLLSVSANAAPVTWTLDGVAFADGYMAEGSFVYDADLGFDGTYSDISITTFSASGTQFVDQFGTGGIRTAVRVAFSNNVDYFFGLVFENGLTNAGGTVEVVPDIGNAINSVDGGCSAFLGCAAPDTDNFRSITGGRVIANVVPIPAAAWLFGSALAGLGWLRRKQTV